MAEFRIIATIVGDVAKYMRAEIKKIERAVPKAVKGATNGLKKELRKDVVRAGLGSKLSKSWRSKFYRNNGSDAAGLVYSKADHIIAAHESGAVIRGRNAVWLAIPTDAAPKRGSNGKRISPTNWPARLGKLRFIARSNRDAVLVADNLRAVGGRRAGTFARASKRAIAKGLTASAVMFVLRRQVRLRRRLRSVKEVGGRWARRLPQMIAEELEALDRENGA